MFSRHQLRQRILQGLYSYYQSEETSPAQTEKNIVHAVEKIYDLYLLLLILFKEFAHEEHLYRTDVQAKFLTKNTDVSPNSIEGNLVLRKLKENSKLTGLIKKKKLNWQNDNDIIRKIFYKIRKSVEYNAFLIAENVTPKDELDFFLKMFKKFAIKNELFVNYLEEKNIYWADGFQFCCEMALKTFKSCVNEPEPVIHDQFRDDAEDREFIHTLVFETIRNDAYWESLCP